MAEKNKVVEEQAAFQVQNAVKEYEPVIVGPDGQAHSFLEVLAQIANDTRIIREKLVGK